MFQESTEVSIEQSLMLIGLTSDSFRERNVEQVHSFADISLPSQSEGNTLLLSSVVQVLMGVE